MHTNPEVLALLALGEDSASPAERAHVDTCPICTRELAELAHLAGVGREVESATPLESPSPEVWRRIQAELGFQVRSTESAEPLTPVRGATPETGQHDGTTSTAPAAVRDLDPAGRGPGGRTRGRRVLALALAAVLALIVGIGVGLGWNRLSQPTPTVVGEAQLEPAAPDWTGSTGEATLERDADGQRELVVRMSTPRDVPGIRYVWVMDPTHTKMQPIGQLTATEGRFSVDSKVNLADFPVVDISEEPVNDVNPKHSGLSIVRGTLNI